MWGESPGWGSNVPLSLGCVVLEHLSGESVKAPNVLVPFPGVARGKRAPRRTALALERQEDEQPESCSYAERTAVTPKAHRAGAVPSGQPSSCEQWPYSVWMHNDLKTNQEPEPEAGDKHKYLVDRADISILSDRKLLRKVRVM